MSKKNKTLKNIILIFIVLILSLTLGLVIYSSDYYHVSEEMYDAIDTLDISSIDRYEDADEISYTVANPKNNIILIPGGKVEAYAYEYLAYKLAMDGNNVTVYKPYLHLAIVFPNHAARFIDEDLNNIIIGHSLGGVVSSLIASEREYISQVVIMGSYSTKDLTDKEVLLITGEFDTVMLDEEYEAAKENYNVYTEVDILGGNHAQFGWYGEQVDDGIATISTLDQQNQTIQAILDFIN